MAYQIYITDGIDTAELDIENIDFKAIFAVADLKDISTRKDNVKTIQLKGTNINNQAFGNFFDLTKTSDLSLATGIFFNYNPLKSVFALVYEESSLIFKGSLRLKDVVVNNGNITYNTFVTGSLIDLKLVLQDKYLTDISFKDLQHRYAFNNIKSSWTGTTEIFNKATSAYTTTTLSDYVYPFSDYGYYFSGTTSINEVNLRNFKPAIYLTSYLDRIFDQLTGYTYSIEASPDFINMFNKIIIPDSNEGNKQEYTGFISTYSKPSATTVTEKNSTYSTTNGWRLIPINQIVQPPSSIIGNVLNLYSSYQDVLSVARSFNADGRLNITFDYIKNSYATPVIAHVEVVRRTTENNNTANSGWSVVTDYQIPLAAKQEIFSRLVSYNIGVTDYAELEQLAVRVNIKSATELSFFVYPFLVLGPQQVYWKVSNVKLTIPKNESSIVRADILAKQATGDVIIPTAPVNIKQSDFLKSIINQFNFYVYSKNENSKHLIFQQYNDYYAYATPELLLSSALDWSNKVDLKDYTIKSNIDLPKAYLYTLKDDTDFLSDTYKKRFNQVYGQYNFNDSYGLVDTKKIELINSPLILITESGTDRKYPAFYKVNNSKKELTKTNIRLAYYNGLQSCNYYTIANNETTGGITTKLTYFTGTTYPQVSNYYIQDGVVKNDIHFNQPIEYYFAADTNYQGASTSFDYYVNQVSDLTNPNVIYIEMKALLNQIDISTLDLRLPIYLNTGEANGAYFKLLSVEYEGADSLSKIQLQKIVF